MNLIIPAIGLEPAPDWGQDLNSSLSLIDTHDHTPGNGVQLSTSSLNINADLTLNGNNLTVVRSVRFDPQVAPLAGGSDVGIVYESGVDLYYNDGNGNQIRLTQSGSIAGTSGSITGLVSPAAASYVFGSKTFVFQQDTNKAANMDIASLIIRKTTTSSPGITLSAPSALSSGYTFTLPPSPPPVPSALVSDASGNLSFTNTTSIDSIDVTNQTSTGSLLVTGVSTLTGNVSVPSGDIIAGQNITAAVGAVSAALIVSTTSVNAATGVKPAGNAGSTVTSASSNVIEVFNPSDSTTRQVVTGAGYVPPYQVVGFVDAAGSLILGGGFSIVHSGTGIYDITYNVGQFNTLIIPTVLLTLQAGTSADRCKFANLSPTGVQVQTYIGGTLTNNGFSILIVGQRA